jgi:hypothetical protein
MHLSAVVLMGLFLAHSPSPRAQSQAEPAGDFGFRLEVGDCLTETFDTFSGVFSKDLGGDPGRSATTRFSLTDLQMRAIYQTMEQIRLFDYPSPFNGVPSGLSEVGTFHPANSYRLEVRNGGVVHTVIWKDAYRPTTTEADRLRALLSMIVGFIHDHPNFKLLPRPIGGCE